MTAATAYALHGLRIASDVPLDGWLIEDGLPGDSVSRAAQVIAPPSLTAPPNLTIVLGDIRAIPESEPPGTTIAHVDADDGKRQLSVVDTGDTFVMAYHGLAELRISHDLTHVRFDLDPSASSDVISTIAGAGLGGFLVTMGGTRPAGNGLAGTRPAGTGADGTTDKPGDIALHASAVFNDSSAIAFVGDSGSGKSTIAALACAGGATLLTDDCLRAGSDDMSAWCYPGTRSVRLRSSASGLADAFPNVAHSVTSDGRTALRLGDNAQQCDPLAAVRLGAVILPRPTEDATGFEVQRLSPTDALVALLPYGRLPNACDEAVVAHHFKVCASLARTIPVCTIALPRQYWLSATRGEDLLAAVGGILSGAPQ